MFRQLAIIIGCLAVGEFVVWLTGVSVPSSIIGMLFLTTMLKDLRCHIARPQASETYI